MSAYLVALGLTLAFELPLAIRLGGRGIVADAVIANLFSHPLAYAAVVHGLLGFAPVESIVVLTEAVLYRSLAGLPWTRSVLVSLVANGVTVLVALAL